jgi:ABC-type multidrug transport system ATPase subunit
LLVLGRPGSGTSTFLSTLGDRLASNLHVEVSECAFVKSYQLIIPQGEVNYNGARSIGPYRKTIKFVEADDKHIPALTVEQTLRIAAEMSTPLNTPLREPLIQFAELD